MPLSFENSQNPSDLLETALKVLEDILIKGSLIPDLPKQLADDPQFSFLTDYLVNLQQFSLAVAKGDLSKTLTLKGRTASSLKELQASLRHLTWQTQMIAQGDFTQTTDFMGDFSTAFNSMVAKLEADRSKLEKREIESRRQSDHMATLFRMGMALTAGLEMDHVMSAIFEQCQTVASVDAFFVGLKNQVDGCIDFPFIYMDGSVHNEEKSDFSTNAGLVETILSNRQVISIANISESEYAGLFPEGHCGNNLPCSFLGIPLILRDQVIGVVAILSFQPGAYSQDQVRLLQTMANQAAIAIENARLYEQVQHMAIIDELTEMYNYRGLMLLGTREVERALRFNHPLAVLFLDIDHFRNFNKHYSHAIGNLILRSFARECRANCRSVDILARFGGEEFVFLLPETGLDAGSQMAERLARSIETLRVDTDKGRLGVTVSIGVAELDASPEDLQVLIDHANQAERLAKANGRNRAEKWKAGK